MNRFARALAILGVFTTVPTAVVLTIDLDGVATINLPSEFKYTGIVNSGDRKRFGGVTTSLENHLDQRRITFRFEARQSNDFGGYKKDPVLLDVSLFNAKTDAQVVRDIASTTINRFYPPTDDAKELSARFAAMAWKPDRRVGDVITKVAEVPKSSSDPERWLIIRSDVARRVRVDLYAWRKIYSLEEALAVVESAAKSAQSTLKLQAHFDAIPGFDPRMADRHSAVVALAEKGLSACGIASLVPDKVVFGELCAAHLSANRRYLRTARVIGLVPLSASVKYDAHFGPKYNLIERLPDQPRKIEGFPELGIAMFYWNTKENKWSVQGLQHSIYEDDDRDNALIQSIATPSPT